MRRYLGGLLGALLICPAIASAQVAPGIFTTVQTTNTGTTSLQVGCAVGSGTCTGGISAGPISGSSLAAESGYVEIQSNVPVSTTYRLYNNSGTLMWNGTTLATGGSISGTTNDIPVFTSSSSIGNSICSQSGTIFSCVNTVSATTLTGTLSTASQTNVTGVGTLTTGTWNATKIGLAYGGTNADLSGTGGTSQFLRQNTLGGAVTVVRPAVADLSDASNVALLNAANVFTAAQTANSFIPSSSTVPANGMYLSAANTVAFATNSTLAASLSSTGVLSVDGFGTHTFSAGGTGSNTLEVRNTTAGTGNLATALIEADGSGALQLAEFSTTYTTGTFDQQNAGAIWQNSAGGLSIVATNASGALRFYSGGTTQRWGINAAGDFTYGASAHISDSVGTPTISGTGFGNTGTISGTDYAFIVAIAANANSGGTVNFGHTWSGGVVCTASSEVSLPALTVTPNTSSVAIGYTNGTYNTVRIFVLCRGV